jgi:hypothetical protein
VGETGDSEAPSLFHLGQFWRLRQPTASPSFDLQPLRRRPLLRKPFAAMRRPLFSKAECRQDEREPAAAVRCRRKTAIEHHHLPAACVHLKPQHPTPYRCLSLLLVCVEA